MPNDTSEVKTDAQDASPEEQEVKETVEEASAQSEPDHVDHEPEIDYAELLRIEKESHDATQSALDRAANDRDNYKEALLKKRQLRQERTTPEETTIIDDVRKAVREELTKPSIESILKELVPDSTKRELVKFYYDKRVVKSGSDDEHIRSDIGLALGMAERKRLEKENLELKRANSMQKTTPSRSGGTADKDIDRPSTGWSQAQMEALNKRAMELNVDPKKYADQAWNHFKQGTSYSILPRRK